MKRAARTATTRCTRWPTPYSPIASISCQISLASPAIVCLRPICAREQYSVFWLGQGSSPTSYLVKLYDQLHESTLRSHYTFVLSQRRDREALDKLIDVAQHDESRDVRHQALFWLGQSKDPRALAFIRDLVTR